MNCLVGLENPKSPTNMGAVLRAAGCFNANEIRYTGTRYAKAVKFQTDTKRVHAQLTPSHQENLLDNLNADTSVIAVELVPGATPLAQFSHPDNALYIFGPEDGSLNQRLVSSADHVIYIPTLGCLNLAATVNVVLYDRQTKLGGVTATDDTIVASRDRNNNLKMAR